jgi:heme/copper-type cytochrome/quinol oxidase subunit 4
MEKNSLVLKVLIISILVFLFLMITAYFLVSNALIQQSSFLISLLYLPLGVIAAFISLSLFLHLKTKKEISMVNFLFEIKKFDEEVRLIYVSSLICFIGWLYWGLSILIYEEVSLPEIIKTILWYTGDIWIFTSLFFTFSFICVTYRWRRRFMKYG